MSDAIDDVIDDDEVEYVTDELANQVSVAGGVLSTLKSVDLYLKNNNLQMGVEQVETRTFEEILEVLDYASENETFLSGIMVDNIVVPQLDGDIDVSMLREVMQLTNLKSETEHWILFLEASDKDRESVHHGSPSYDESTDKITLLEASDNFTLNSSASPINRTSLPHL
ncbi:Aldolase-type TIM barrel [Artemisia annua]|uniref:Aldolase-type TIM barrel n=1 Tax=Artemisia annua TaxID=35608 RepID=A0A2U1N3S4_ARTAN|nr:Aldolase-type TIM barrel [Artemisia annua]